MTLIKIKMIKIISKRRTLVIYHQVQIQILIDLEKDRDMTQTFQMKKSFNKIERKLIQMETLIYQKQNK